MTAYQTALGALTTAVNSLSPNAKRTLSERIEMAAGNGDPAAMTALAAALPAFNDLCAALDAKPRNVADAFAEELDAIWRSDDGAAISALASQISAAP